MGFGGDLGTLVFWCLRRLPFLSLGVEGCQVTYRSK